MVKGGNVMENKRALSAIVTTLIIILLAIVALGVVWVVVRNVTDNAKEQVELSSKCQQVDIGATILNDNGVAGDDYSLTLTRTGTGDEIGGVKVVLFNSTANSEVLDFGMILNPLETKTNSSLSLTLPVLDADKVEITPYFTNDADVEQLCPTTITTEF